MKFRIVAGLLIASLLLNVAGLIFFIEYLKLRGHYKSISRQKDLIARSLVLTHLAYAGSNPSPDRVIKRTFYSQVDGQPDVYALIEPVIPGKAKELTLLVYLHGMGGTYQEPFIYPASQSIASTVAAHNPSAIFLSCNYRQEASWGKDIALSDISQNIREICQQYPVSRIVLMGTSMGGCIALTYTASAPPDIKGEIAGVVSAESTGELIPLYQHCPLPAIKPAMIAAFGGTPEQVPQIYKSKSFLNNLDSFPPVPVAVLSAQSDEIVPPAAQHHIVQALSKRGIPVKLIEAEGTHRPLPGTLYVEGLDFVLSGGSSS